jgi:hypothetical protein
MGFDLFMSCCRNGESATFKREIAEEIFNRDAIDPTTPLTEVRYADGRGEVYGAEEDDVDGIMLAHFGGRTILERVWELAHRTGSFFYWPGDPDGGPWIAVTDPQTLQHMWPELLKEPDAIGVARSARELSDVIGLV